MPLYYLCVCVRVCVCVRACVYLFACGSVFLVGEYFRMPLYYLCVCVSVCVSFYMWVCVPSLTLAKVSVGCLFRMKTHRNSLKYKIFSKSEDLLFGQSCSQR